MTVQNVEYTSNATTMSDRNQIYTQEDFNPGNIPQFYGNIGLNYDFTEWLIGNITVKYIGEKDRSEEMDFDAKRDQRDPVDAVTHVNATLTFSKIWKNMELQLSGYNLLNQDYRMPDPDGFIENDIPHPGSTFMTKLMYKL